jgi:hypothetical protein
LDPSTGTLRQLNEDSIIKRGEVLAIAFKIFVKERQSDSHYYQLQIVSSDLDSFFPDKISPSEYLAKESIREKLDDCLEVLLRKNVWVEAGVQRTEGTDQQMRIVHTSLII